MGEFSESGFVTSTRIPEQPCCSCRKALDMSVDDTSSDELGRFGSARALYCDPCYEMLEAARLARAERARGPTLLPMPGLPPTWVPGG